MNDLLDNTINPKNIEELYNKILEIVSSLYEKCILETRVFNTFKL